MSKTKTLIDAEAWLEQVSDSWMYKNTARKIIAAAPRVEVPCWVSVDEELPTEPDEYIVMIAGGASPTALLFQVNDEGEGVWFEETEDSTTFYKVTHWMPMPMGPGNNPSVTEDRDTSLCTREAKQERAEGGKKPNVCKCRSCGAEIVWVTMQSGKKMPCDATLIRCREDKSAKTSFVLPSGKVMSAVEAPDGVADFWGYRSHFETCPRAEEFRRRK